MVGWQGTRLDAEGILVLYLDGEQCGRCRREDQPVIDLGGYGSDPHISNFLCLVCLDDIRALFAKGASGHP